MSIPAFVPRTGLAFVVAFASTEIASACIELASAAGLVVVFEHSSSVQRIASALET